MLADDCYHVYVDCGTNIGVQIHKLYNPGNFSGALVMEHFNFFFGETQAERNSVCAFGFEPNPRHARILEKLVDHYSALGRHLHVFSAAAGTSDGRAKFTSDNDLGHKEWGSTISMLPPGTPPDAESVEVIDVAGWMARNVLGRRLPNLDGEGAKRPPRIIMKLDIEGTDELVLQRLLDIGVLCCVSFLYTENHVRPEVLSSVSNVTIDAGCPTKLAFIDDESYLTWELGEPLPP